jgi:hypothetical protein
LVNLIYEIYSYKTNSEYNPVGNTDYKLPRMKKFVNKLKKSRKFRTLLSAGIVLFSFGLSSFAPKVPNVTKEPISFVFHNENLESIELTKFMNFVSDPNFVKTNENIKRIIINSDMEKGEKIILISYQLDNILNILGRKESLIFLSLIMKTLITGTIPGYHGLNCMFGALHKLYEDGKISTKLYDLLLEILREMIKTTQVKPAKLDEIMKPAKIME